MKRKDKNPTNQYHAEQQSNRYLSQGVAAVDAEIRTGDVLGRVAEQEGDGAHEVFGGTHLPDGDEGSPLVAQLRVLIENLAGTIQEKKIISKTDVTPKSNNGSGSVLQSSQHISRTNAINSNIVTSPLNRE